MITRAVREKADGVSGSRPERKERLSDASDFTGKLSSGIKQKNSAPSKLQAVHEIGEPACCLRPP